MEERRDVGFRKCGIPFMQEELLLLFWFLCLQSSNAAFVF